MCVGLNFQIVFCGLGLGNHNNLMREKTQIKLSHHLLIPPVYFLIITSDIRLMDPLPTSAHHTDALSDASGL